MDDINCAVVSIAGAIFKPDALTPRQPYITRTTMKLIRYRRYVMRALRSAMTISDITAWDNLKKYSETDELTKVTEQDA
eukprot:2826181-Pyramimonas_sp.AAC.1